MNQTESKVLAELTGARESIAAATERIKDQISYLVALRDSLNQIREQIAPLMVKLENGTSGFIENPLDHKASLEQRSALYPAPKIVSEVPEDTDREALWQRMARLMRGVGSFTMSQVGKAAEADMGKSLGPNRPQTVRNSLFRHPEVFRRNEDGTWTVIQQ
jgi:hypothetical protein